MPPTKDARPNITFIRWPGNSPDLNPIENVWSWMKRQLKEAPCTNLEELKREILKLWCQKMDDCDTWLSQCPGGWKRSSRGKEQ